METKEFIHGSADAAFIDSIQRTRGPLTQRPAASIWNRGILYYAEDVGLFFQSDGQVWKSCPLDARVLDRGRLDLRRLGTDQATGAGGDAILHQDGFREVTPVAAGLTSPLTTKGDLWNWTTTNARLPVGTNGRILEADSTQAAGLGYSTRDFDANTHKINNVVDPVSAQDAATKNYVDTTHNYPFVLTKPVFANWTSDLRAGGSITDNTASNPFNIYIKGTTNGAAFGYSLAFKTFASTNADFGLVFSLGTNTANIAGFGCGFKSTVTNPNRLLAFEVRNDVGTLRLAATRYTNTTTWSAYATGPLAEYTVPELAGGILYMRCTTDGTNIKFYLSCDGKDFNNQFYTETIATFLGSVDQSWFGVDPYSDFAEVALQHYKES